MPDDVTDAIDESLRAARPTARDVVAAFTRARVREVLFGHRQPVTVGRYTLESRLGAGGGGEVFVATDPELSRKVALKLLHAADPDRLLAEGQALARLSHPNVVPVFDTGRDGDRVYVVMELVEGATLRTYATQHSTREIVHAYRQAGAGLAAAHRAGFVHRDFKPDNALVGDDGRVRVVDFGLARAHDQPMAAAGTPRYMAPEQLAGDALSPAADQYAFCVSLREGVATHGEVPRWIDAIVQRGTMPAPSDRFASMDELLAALASDPASRWRRRAVVAGIAVLAGATFLIGRAGSAKPSCDPTTAFGNAWDPVAARTHIESLHTAYAPEAAGQLVKMLDDYAGRWRASHRDACIAYRDGGISSTLFDQRVACLTTARAALARETEVARTTPADRLAGTLLAATALPDLDRCRDPNALGAQPPQPIAARVATLDDELAALEVEVRAARPDARARVEAAVTRARTVDYAPVIARALRLAGRAADFEGLREQAIAPLTEATHLALQVDDRALAVEAFALRMWDAAMTEVASPDAGLDLIQAVADGLPERSRGTRAELANSIGGVALAAGDRPKAREAFTRALTLSRGVTGPKAFELAGVLSNLAIVTDDPARAREYANERIAIVERGLGPAHPLALAARVSAAYLETHRDRARELLSAPCDRLADLQPDHGLEILDCEVEVGWLAFERGDEAEMRRAFSRAVATEHAGGSGPRLELARARVTGDARALDAALAALGPLEHAQWWTLFDAADLEIARGRLDIARGLLERVAVTNPTVLVARRLAYVRARTGAVDAALEWYRGAGGYDAEIAALTNPPGSP